MTTGVILAQGLKIDWAQMPTYNTVMSVAAGAGLLMIVGFIRRLADPDRPLSAEGWAMGFGVVGVILAIPLYAAIRLVVREIVFPRLDRS